jgi:hypothetical protein
MVEDIEKWFEANWSMAVINLDWFG